MKKIIALLLALIMCISLCACGTTTNKPDKAENNPDAVEEESKSSDIIVQANEPTKLNDDITITLLAYYSENNHMYMMRKHGRDLVYEGEYALNESERNNGFMEVFFKVEYTGQGDMSMADFGTNDEYEANESPATYEASIMPDFYLVRNNNKIKLGGEFINEYGESAVNDYIQSGGDAICVVYKYTTLIPDEGIADLGSCCVSVTIDDINYMFQLENAIEAPDTEVLTQFS